MKRVFLGIGTNLGDRKNNLQSAVEKIGEHIGKVVHCSSVYETEPWGFVTKDQFLNMVVEVKTKLKPSGVLGRLLMIESLLGRLREGKLCTSRIIDIDILLYNDQVIEKKALVIPHPRMHERKFVLVPLCEIAPEVIHPIFGKDMKSLLKECRDKGRVLKYSQ
ncbi:MAG: 2-amino-4-hydroxy-6-hydroxymethyldihydropteridine diphosphokinase [Bacteroidia bacterium]|nr:2-amino-4-hydroxy-6-hydroxymethyldihydropteridine diphosphokinase [Bacteroidia bacterium]